MATPKTPTPISGPPELPRRVVEVPGGKPKREVKPAPEQSERRLHVGRDITLTGEITTCDHLIVEGTIDAKVRDCRTIDIAAGGTFRGAAEVESGMINGTFEGDLVVRHRVTLGQTGLVRGTLRYGELAIEAGGRLVGTVEPLNGDPDQDSAVPADQAAPISRIGADSGS